jgi:hypothetical protein
VGDEAPKEMMVPQRRRWSFREDSGTSKEEMEPQRRFQSYKGESTAA